MKLLHDNVPFPFGAHKGVPCAKVNLQYLRWLATKPHLLEGRPEVVDWLERKGIMKGGRPCRDVK